MIKIAIGLTIGIVVTLFVSLAMDSSNDSVVEDIKVRQCMTQQVHIFDTQGVSTAPFIIIGEAVICARDWEISNVVGPTAEYFYGKIKLRDWNSEEFIEDEREEGNDKGRKNN